MTKISIRTETKSDIADITDVTQAAFLHAPHTDHNEHLIIAELRKASALTLSLVAKTDEGDLIGHVAVSPVKLTSGDGDWFGLGPIAVLPEWQGQGVGGLLMRRAIADLQQQGAAGCVLLGDPAFYGRFGFVADKRLKLADVPAAYFQVLLFQGAMPNTMMLFISTHQANETSYLSLLVNPSNFVGHVWAFAFCGFFITAADVQVPSDEFIVR